MRQKKEERDLKVNYRDITRNKIDKEISDWNNSIMKRIDEETPTTTIRYLPHPKESDLLKALQIAHNQIKNNLTTAEQRVLLRHIQKEIKIENLRLFDEAWERMINRLEIDQKEREEREMVHQHTCGEQIEKKYMMTIRNWKDIRKSGRRSSK